MNVGVAKAAILTTLVEFPGHAVPEGHIYAALMGKMDLTDYQEAIADLRQLGYIATGPAPHTVQITDHGIEASKRVDLALELLRKAKEAQT